jgi:hypothetical protein
MSSEERQAAWSRVRPLWQAALDRQKTAEHAVDMINMRVHGFLGERLAFERARRLMELKLELRRAGKGPLPANRPDLAGVDACESFILQ